MEPIKACILAMISTKQMDKSLRGTQTCLEVKRMFLIRIRRHSASFYSIGRRKHSTFLVKQNITTQ